MPPDSDDAAFLFDMLRYAERVVRITTGRSFEEFLADEVLQLAVQRAVEVVGEAARNVSMEFQEAHPEIAWQGIVAQRHVLAHEYGDIIHEKIWRVATTHVPELIGQIRPLLPPIPPDPDPE